MNRDATTRRRFSHGRTSWLGVTSLTRRKHQGRRHLRGECGKRSKNKYLIGETPKRYWQAFTYANHKASRDRQDNPPMVVMVMVMMIIM